MPPPKVYHANPCSYCRGTKGLWYCDPMDPSCRQSVVPSDPCTACENRGLAACDFDVVTCEKYRTSQIIRDSCASCRDGPSNLYRPGCLEENPACYRKRERLIITQTCEYCFRELHSIDGCDVTDAKCQRRRCLLQEAPLTGLTLYAFIAGVPKAFELAPGYCVSPDQHRRVGSAHRDVYPTGAGESGGHIRAPPNPHDLPRIYVCKSNLQLLQVQHPPFHDGAYNDTPYVLAPQWNLGPLGTLHHNLTTLGKISSEASQDGNAATRPGEPNPITSDWKHETEFKIYPDPLLSKYISYQSYAFQFPGAPAVDENGVEI